MLAEKITRLVSETYGGTVPQNAQEIVFNMLQCKDLGWKAFERLEAKHSVTRGFFEAVKNAIIADRKANVGTMRSGADARADRVLTVSNSAGRKTARRFS